MKTLSLIAIAAIAAFGFTACDDKKIELPAQVKDAAKTAVDKGTEAAKAATD